MAKHIQVILADDHFPVRQGLKALLEKEPDFNIVGQAGDGLETIDLIDELKPDLLVSDLTMPNLNGFDILRHVQNKKYSHLKVIILSMHTSDEHISRALQLGARAYVLKSASSEELVDAANAVINGRYYLSQKFSAKGIDYFLSYDLQLDAPHDQLTRREREVLQLVAEGRTNVEISQILGIASRTVETHRANVMRKLEFQSTTDLIRYAIRHDILPLEDQ